MTRQWRRSAATEPEPPVTREEFYECTNCLADYDEWIEDCPVCGQLVVRVVDPTG